MSDYQQIDNDDSNIYSATDLNFRAKPKCKHKFVRKTATEVICKNCSIGFYDTGDFPIDELNTFYK